MSVAEITLAWDRAQESTSATKLSGPFLPIAFLGCTLVALPMVLPPKHETYKIVQVPSVKSNIVKITTWVDTQDYFLPRTRLGKRLLAMRTEAISKGMTLLDADEIISEVANRRGEPFSG